jgi:hypothetical protein
MNQIEPHYAIKPFQISIASARPLHFPLGVLSTYGIYRAFADSEDIYEAFLMAKPVQILIDDQIYRGRLVHVRGQGSAHFAVKWVYEDEKTKELINSLVQNQGNQSPKLRRYQRFEVANNKSTYEIPNQALVRNLIGTKRARVVNFSFCGLNVEYFCGGASLAEYVGQRIQLSLITDKQKTIQPISARIVRIYDEMLAPAQLSRGLGLKFVRFSHVGRRHYLQMILAAGHTGKDEIEV